MTYENKFIEEIEKRKQDGYAESKALISYFLNLYFRLDYGDERDYICDSSGDKGIDAIYIDDDNQEIYFIQGKFSFKDVDTKEIGFDLNKYIGDTQPKEFIGSLSQFNTKEQIEHILSEATTSSELKRVLKELNITDKIESYSKRGIYVTTRFRGGHTDALDKISEQIEFFTPIEFESEEKRYTNIISGNITNINLEFHPVGNIINAPHNAIICMLRVKDLVEIEGIEDYTVFDKNVRSWLGRNKVYKSIKNNLIDEDFDQANNILMHNGITIVGRSVTYNEEENKITAEGISIVNGCQSTFAYYDNKDKLSAENTVLVKIVPQGEHEEKLGKNIVLYSNTQSQVKTSDLVSLTDQAKVIQEQFTLNSDKWCLKIRAGVDNNIDCNGKTVVKLAELAQYVASFYNVGNIAASNKNKLLESSFYEVFNRNLEFTHYEIVLTLVQIIDEVINKIKEDGTSSEKILLHSYLLTKLFILNIFKKIYIDVHSNNIYDFIILNKDKINSPEYRELLKATVHDIIIEIDSYLEDKEKLNEYKNILKNKDESDALAKEIIKAYKKEIRKKPETSLDIE